MEYKVDKDKLDNVLSSFLDESFLLNDIPGISVGVSIGDVYEFRQTRGYRDFSTRKSSEPDFLQPDDIFHCASVSKLFTTSAVMLLIETAAKASEARSKEFNLASRPIALLSDLSFSDGRFSDVQLWNLLSHTSGLGDCDDYRWYAPETDDDALRRYVYSSEVVDQPMLWPPQAKPADETNSFRYSNVAFELLGHLASEYSSIAFDGRLLFEDLVRTAFFKPLGMTSSSMNTFARPDWGSDIIARPHEKADDNSIVLCENYPYNRAHGPSSTLTTNTGDLLKWGRAHLNKKVFNDETYDVIWKEYATVPNNGEKMGLGWFIRKQKVSGKEFTLLGHEGTDDGFRASFWICPELDMVTVVLSNMSGSPVKKINKKMFNAAVNTLLQEPI